MKYITDFLEQFRVSSKPLIWKLDRKGREELEMFISDEKRHARMDFAKRLKEMGFLDYTRLLDPREVEILDMRLIEGKTYEEVGKEFGVTRERIRVIEAKAIERIKEALVWKPEEDGVV